MRTRLYFLLMLLLCLAGSAQAVDLGALSGKEAAAGLKEALNQGAAKAVTSLGKADGYLGNEKVRIALPENLEKVAGLMRRLGAKKQVEELETAMNRAAEAAVPEARTLLVNAIRQISLKDAKGILAGGEDAATQYFRRTTAGPLAEKFQPVVARAIGRVKLAERYDAFAGKAAKYGLVKEADTHLDAYVTGKALDGLYLMIAEEEKAIRANPLAATGSLAKKVFGLLR